MPGSAQASTTRHSRDTDDARRGSVKSVAKSIAKYRGSMNHIEAPETLFRKLLYAKWRNL
jgi:hypothetical protein